MTKAAAVLGLLCLTFSGCGLTPASPRKGPPLVLAKSPEGQLAGMVWLAGDWRGKSPRGVWEASYTSPEGGMILGTSKEYIDGQVRAFEYERFQSSEDGVFVFPRPNGKQSVPFKLTKHDLKSRRATFENPEHDFPKVIDYWRVDEDTLLISVVAPGDQPGRMKGFRLVLKRQ